MASTNKVGDERTGESSLSSLVQAGADVSVIPAASAEAKSDSFASFLAYQYDVIERGILFWDTLRQRADNLLEHERLGLPALLNFKWELLLDARAFEKPANYALLRITEAQGCRASDCVNEEKAPVIIVDPLAGHGPGIGGFKRESEVGMALLEGHPSLIRSMPPSLARGCKRFQILGLQTFYTGSIPMRTSRYLLSEQFCPMMRGIELLAEAVRDHRHPVADNSDFIVRERAAIAQVSQIFETVRVWRIKWKK